MTALICSLVFTVFVVLAYHLGIERGREVERHEACDLIDRLQAKADRWRRDTARAHWEWAGK